MYSKYYLAKVLREKTWFLAGVLRNESNLVLDRSLDAKNNLFEFFVSEDQEDHFLDVMESMKKRGVVLSLQKAVNRFCI